MQNNNVITPVILSGGSGTRLWPLSRISMPKQFAKIVGDKTLFQTTLDRVAQISTRDPLVVTNADHRFLVAEHLRTSCFPSACVIAEPRPRNTAPAITLAALKLSETEPDALMLICPADHHIEDVTVFRTAVEQAISAAENDHIVTFGIKPTHADTAYGYIETTSANLHDIGTFVEKPDIQRAEEFVTSGRHFWNSGIFLVKAKFILAEVRRLEPLIHQACLQAWEKRTVTEDFITVDEDAFTDCPSESIDYAIMEKTKSAYMVPMDCLWSDLGTWESTWRGSAKDESGNVLIGDVKQIGSSNNYIRSQDKFVAIIGCEDLVVIESGDAILVCAKSATNEIKSLVETLVQEKRKEAIHHPRVFRPWGNYEGVVKGDRYQVKRIIVTPGEQLSLQKHFHRAEHWIVVRGVALITCGDDKKLVHENQSTYIPLGQTHRMENPGKIPLELIEVQSGSYLGEDDIVRLQDKYGRRETDGSAVVRVDEFRIAANG
ncbi:mannose-1-phosphate guanylyltransferase/mannose-6-phosphate isomerase [Granulosicoccus sp.]|nr:mannose-1-phosphate guanylyltransferase/mannose-6-phosphate isomerase [Granulosicoccus sp.]